MQFFSVCAKKIQNYVNEKIFLPKSWDQILNYKIYILISILKDALFTYILFFSFVLLILFFSDEFNC